MFHFSSKTNLEVVWCELVLWSYSKLPKNTKIQKNNKYSLEGLYELYGETNGLICHSTSFQSKNKKNKVVHTIKERITFLKLFLMDHNNHNSKLNYFFWQKMSNW